MIGYPEQASKHTNKQASRQRNIIIVFLILKNALCFMKCFCFFKLFCSLHIEQKMSVLLFTLTTINIFKNI